MKNRLLSARGALGLGVVLFLSQTAFAVGTRTFQLDTVDRLSGGESKGVVIGADGVLTPGFALGSVPVADAGSVMSALTLADGSVLLGSAPSGKIHKVTGDKVDVFADTGALAVTALAEAPGGGVLAATLPDGKIFKIAGGKSTLLGTVKDASLWALVVTKAGIFAAGGGDKKGAIYKIEASGASSVYFQSEEQHLVSLAASSNGDLFAGASGKSVVYRVTGPGKGTVLADFPGNEIKSIVVTEGAASKDKNAKAAPVRLYVVANDYPEPPEPPRRSPNAGRQAPGPSNAPRPKPGKGALYRVDLGGRSEKLMAHGDTHYLSLAVDADKNVAYVGAGVDGKVYSVDDAHAVSQVADTDERQIVALTVPSIGPSTGANKGVAFVAASDPVVFHKVKAPTGDDATWTSKVLDAQMPARFGTISYRGSGKVELATRTGNTKTADGTWSDWSAAIHGPAKITSPGARYLQVRARFVGDPNATLAEITIPFVTENARAIVTEVGVDSKTFFTKEPATSVPSTGNEAPKANARIKLSWKIENPDADALRYRVAFRKEGQLTWRDILRADETYTRSDYDWDTSVLSEGRYRIKVEASDELANPPETTERHSLVSESFVVDNTPPVIEKAALEGGKLKVTAKDGISPIARIEVAVDGRPDFRPLTPTDGLFDSVTESGEGSVSLLAGSGRHLYFVRVVDGSGNATTREVEGP